MNKFQSHTFSSNDTSTKWLSILFLCLTNNLFGSIHQFSFLYKAQSQTHFSVDISANWKRMCTLLHIFVNVFDNGPNEHLKVWTTLIKTVGLIAIKYFSNSNVCFKIIRSKHSSNTLIRLLRIFMRQTLIFVKLS